jgi:hypothetical protein
MSRIVSATCVVLLTLLPFGTSHVSASEDSSTTTIPTTESTYVYDLENEPGECIGFLPKPGCGKKPEQAGDRGGSLQYITFAIMLGGLGVIGTIIGRNIVKRDREIAERISEDQ